MTDAIMMYIDGVRTRASGDVVISLSVDSTQALQVQGFISKVGQPVAVAFAEVGDQPDTFKAVQKKGEFGEFARGLKLSGFFRRPEVWKAVGTDQEFREWVQLQKSVISGNQDHTDSGPRCEAAHVRRAGESGTGYKADYACVPLTHEEHLLQHSKGEVAVLLQYRKGIKKIEVDEAKDWFNKARIECVQDWCWETAKDQMGEDSWTKISPVTFRIWANSKAVLSMIPPIANT